MAETVDFILRLQDQVSGAARSAANAVRGLQNQAQNAAQQMGRAQSAAQKMNAAIDATKVSAAARALSQQAREAEKAARATRALGLAQLQAQKMDAARNRSKTFLGGLKAALPFRSVSDYAQGAFFGEMAANAAIGIAGAFVSGAKSAVDFIASGVKMAFVEGGKAENLRLSYKLLLGEAGGSAALGDISGFAGKTKYDDDKIAEMMRPLFNAGLKGRGARSAFAASGDLEAAGLGSAQDFIDQFAKIQLKGGVTEKLLVGMGVNIRDFKTALAGSTDQTKQETAFKKATEGKSDPQAIMNAIYQGIQKRQGGQLGTGTEAASKTLSARLEKLGDLPSQYLKKVSESPAWTTLSDKFGDVLARLDPDSARGQKIVSSIMRVFDKLAGWIDKTLTAENVDGFVNGVSKAVDLLGKLPDLLASVYRISVDIAKIWAAKKLADGVMGFAGGLAKGMGGAVAGAEAANTAAVGATGATTTAVAGAGARAILGISAGALLLNGEQQGQDADAQNDAMVKSGQRREVKHWWGSTFEDASSARVKPPTITINVGDVHMETKPGASGEEHADEFFARLDKHMAEAANQGGGH